MNAMAPPRPTDVQSRRVRLITGPAAAAEARRQVRTAVGAWRVPVDPDVAVLLTSDLVTNALRAAADGTVMLAVRCLRGQLRVEVHGIRPGAETGPGLMLVATLSDGWGSCRTPEGSAVYFTLAFQPAARRQRRPRPGVNAATPI